MPLELANHPCFNPSASKSSGRVHLPVAQRCNIQCNFCNRKFDCVNESRPGVTSHILTPRQGLRYLEKAFATDPNLAVVGIAGPGDPFANPLETMETLRLVRAQYPDVLLCVATNGLGLGPYIEELAALPVTHITITINAVDPSIAGEIYAWARDYRKIHRKEAAGRLMIERQLTALRDIKRHGMIAKVNSILIPGVNEHHLTEIAARVKEHGADIMNVIPLIPTAHTAFEEIPAPDALTLQRLRFQCGQQLPQMFHCARCRADACGKINADNPQSTELMLAETKRETLAPTEERPHVAVASQEGALVNLHLGEATCFHIFGRVPEDAGRFRHMAVRQAPASGGGPERWFQLAEQLRDCRTLLVSAAGDSPCRELADHGIQVLQMEGLIEEGLRSVYEGTPLPRALRRRFNGCEKDTDGCRGTGTGCG